jgi:hypothetical protein
VGVASRRLWCGLTRISTTRPLDSGGLGHPWERQPHLRYVHAASLSLVAVLLACCSSVVATAPSASPTSASQALGPSTPADWQTITDSTDGYVFRYPSGWVDVSGLRGDPPGSHEVANRAAAASPASLGPTDWHFYVRGAFPKNSTNGCGEPIAGYQSATVVDGRQAKLFVRQGTQGDPNQSTVDVIAERNGTCTWLQQVTGNRISTNEAMATLKVIQASFRFAM